MLGPAKYRNSRNSLCIHEIRGPKTEIRIKIEVKMHWPYEIHAKYRYPPLQNYWNSPKKNEVKIRWSYTTSMLRPEKLYMFEIDLALSFDLDFDISVVDFDI